MIQTYTEILTAMCDEYDSYIAPKRMRRDNTNFLYLVMKAIAKGYESIANLYVLVRGKFDPEVCPDEDLESLAKITGTKRLLGSSSGLIVYARNSGIENVTLVAGSYRYQYSDQVAFIFTVPEDAELIPSAVREYAAFSDETGVYAVSAVSNMQISRVDNAEISPDIVFSCDDNGLLLGSNPETNFEFRNRILNDTSRQDSLKELELEIANLPYVFDCKIVFNQTQDVISYGAIDVPPYYMLLNINGDPRDDIARIVAEKSIYPTVEVEPTKFMKYLSDVFVGGMYKVFYNLFSYVDYQVHVVYKYNDNLIFDAIITEAIEAALVPFKSSSQKHVSFVTEDVFYDAIKSLTLPSFKLLDIKLSVDGVEVPYIEVPPTSIARLDTITYDGAPL